MPVTTLGVVAKIPPALPISHTGVLGFKSWLDVTFQLPAAADGSSTRVPAIHVGDPHGAPGFGLAWPWLLWHLGSKQVDGILYVCLLLLFRRLTLRKTWSDT